jgi:radical SAM superfamily enzyme YgiQ (UPF0313 family)
MKIVFGYPSWTGETPLFGWFARRNSTWPCLSLAVIAAACEQAGHEAVIIDAEALQLTNNELARRIVAEKPDIVGFSAYTPFAHLSADVASDIKKRAPYLPIIVGGPHVTITKEKALLDCYDYAFMGEAEKSLPEFLNAFPFPLYIQNVKGIIYRDRRGGIISTGEAWLRDTAMRKEELGGRYPLDEIPLPARHLLPMRKYRLGTRDGRRYFTSLQTARGCPWR